MAPTDLSHRARTGLLQILEKNPLMVGAATLAVGVIAGLLIPETEKENELMGETRDRLVEEVKEAGQQTLEKGKHVAEAVAGKVKDEVKNVAKEAVNTAKEEARNQNLTPAAKPEVHEHELAKR